MPESPIDHARHALGNFVEEFTDPQKRQSNLAGIQAVFSSKGADRIVEVADGTVEQGRRVLGLPTPMDGHRERLDVRLEHVERLPRTNLDRSEIEFLKAYQHATATSLIQQAAHLDKEGHGAGLVATMVDRAVESVKEASPALGKLAEKGLDKVDWSQIETVFDPEHAEHASNWQGIAACVVVASELAPLLKPELLAEKGAAAVEKQLQQAVQRQAEEHPKQFLEGAQKALEWAGKHLPENAKKLFDKVLDKMMDYAKEHYKVEARLGPSSADTDRREMAKMSDYTGHPATQTGRVVAVDADVVIQRVGDRFVRYNTQSLGGHVPHPGEIATLGNGVAKPLLPKLEHAIAEADRHGRALPPLSDLRQAEPGKSYAGTMHHLEGDTYYMSTGRGQYVVFDARADLHGHAPPLETPVTVRPDGHVAAATPSAHSLVPGHTEVSR